MVMLPSESSSILIFLLLLLLLLTLLFLLLHHHQPLSLSHHGPLQVCDVGRGESQGARGEGARRAAGGSSSGT
eukprot:3185747-Rhodomonas_salina.1